MVPRSGSFDLLQGAEVLFYRLDGIHKKKEQYGENQHGAWMSVMKGHALQMAFLQQQTVLV
jgi:N-carbamoylputrescine amidase